MASTVFFVQLDHKMLIVGNGKLRQCKNGSLRFLSSGTHQMVIRSERGNDLFLNSGALGYLFIDDFERDVIHIEWHMGGIFQLRMEIEQSVVRVNSFQRKLDAEAFTPDMFYLTPVVLMDGLHNQPDEQGRFAP